MTKTERQLNLIAFLLAQRVPITKRTILTQVDGYSESGEPDAVERRFERDKQDIHALGVALDFGAAPDGTEGYTIRREATLLPHIPLTADERVLLESVGRAFLDQAPPSSVIASELTTALLKLKFDRPDDASPAPPTSGDADAAEDAAPAPSIITRRGLEGRRESGVLDALTDAVLKRHEVQFAYAKLDARAADAEPRTVRPYALLFVAGFWYLHGHDIDRDALRTFKLWRIQGKVKRTRAKTPGAPADFEVPPDLDLDVVTRSIEIPPSSTASVESVTAGPVRFQADADIAFMLKEQLQAAPHVELQTRPDGTIDITLDTSPAAALDRLYLQWLPHLRLKAPPHLQQETLARLKAMRKLYE